MNFAEFLEVNNQYSIRARMLLPYIAYNMCDDLCQIIRDYFQSLGKGCQIIRRAEFLKEVWYTEPYTQTYPDPTINHAASAA